MDARARLKAEAHLLERLVDVLRGQVDQEAAMVSLDAYHHLGLLDAPRAELYRQALSTSDTHGTTWPPTDARDRAVRYAESLLAALGDEPDDAALRYAASALAALREVGVISLEQWGDWYGRFFSHGSNVEGVYAGPSGWMFLATSGDDPDVGEALPEEEYRIFDARDLAQVIAGPFPLQGGLTLTSVELYADGVRLNWHGLRESPGQLPVVDDEASIDEQMAALEAHKSFAWPYTVKPMRDDLGTEYREAGGGGGGWTIHRPKLIMASSMFTPAVPTKATQLEVQVVGVGAVTVPLDPA